MKIKISKEISLPMDAVTQTLAAIGRKGAGKTYLATMIAEQMLDASAQVIVIDPVGNWWGLRVGADGKSKGKDIFVIGGEHGDIPVIPEAGARVAKLLVEKSISAVIDVSGFRLGERKRFCTDFGEELLHLKKTRKTPVHIFIEEAQLIIPQRVGPDEARMVGAFEQIVRLGRNYGIGCTLITQRPQSVNKEVLSQVECLCVLQVTGPHERKALEEWVQEAGADRKLVGELPGLGRGEGYIWSPAWLRIYQRVHFSKKETFDASATPTVGTKTKAVLLSKQDVESLRADMAEVITQAEKDNPVVLRRKIAELERQNTNLLKHPFQKDFTTEQIADIVAPYLAEFEKEIDLWRNLVNHYQKIHLEVSNLYSSFKIPDSFRAKEKNIVANDPRLNRSITNQFEKTTHVVSSAYIDKDGMPIEKIGTGERAILIATAQYSDGVTREQLTVLTQYKRSSRDAYIQRLQAKGYVAFSGRDIKATQDGINFLGPDYAPLPTGAALREHLMRTLPEGERKILSVLIEACENPLEDSLVTREDLSTQTGYQRSTRDAYLQRLSARQLVSFEGRGMVKASEILFEE